MDEWKDGMTNAPNLPICRSSNLPVITGLGLVTPLGLRTDEVWSRLCAGENGIRSTIRSPVSELSSPCARVESFNVDEIVRTGRVRRSSAISHFAVGAAALALRDANLTPHPRIGVIVAVSMGGVVYSRRFHQEFIQGGGGNVSPMLFPETVYNAPASHVAAVFGLTEVNYTLLGGASAALNAVAMGCDLLAAGMVDQCLVIAAEELDWIMVAAYMQYGMVARERNGIAALSPFDRRRNGLLGGEGAVAMVIESAFGAHKRGVKPYARLRSCDRGFPFQGRRAMAGATGRALAEGIQSSDIRWADVGGVICSANGTFVDRVEATALADQAASVGAPVPVTSLKGALGEAHAMGGLFQVAAGALALRHRQFPPTVGTTEPVLDSTRLRLVTQTEPLRQPNLLVLCVGFNEQVSVVVLDGE
jgi:3-oxoacyl-[acyl-carrier-protein] synthase II